MKVNYLLATVIPAVIAQDGQGGQDLTGALSANSDLSQLASLIKGSPQLASAFSAAKNITLLAPNNNALGVLLNSSAGKTIATDAGAVAALLSYHILNGTYYSSQITKTPNFLPTLLNNASWANVTGGQRLEAVSINNATTFYSGLLQSSTVKTANQNFTGGTIHVIDRVLTLPPNVSTTLLDAKLSSLYGALQQAKLIDALDGLKDTTIFVPNNAAFQAIASGLKNISSDDLAKVLTYHVVNGTSVPLYSSAIKDNTTAGTLNGAKLNFHLNNGTVFVNNAKVVVPDVLVAGGVVHIIDNVLNPSNTTGAPSTSATAGSPAFSGASSASDVPFTSGVPSATGTIGGGPVAATSKAATSTSSKGAAAAMRTAGVVNAAALIGVGAVIINL